MPRPKGSKNKVKTTKVTADFAAQIAAKHILRTKEKLNRMLAENTGKDYETICADTERDNWKSAEEACEYGLIDKVITFHEA